MTHVDCQLLTWIDNDSRGLPIGSRELLMMRTIHVDCQWLTWNCKCLALTATESHGLPMTHVDIAHCCFLMAHR
eukprot:5980659-Karenia_brevis.AAC.1